MILENMKELKRAPFLGRLRRGRGKPFPFEIKDADEAAQLV